MCGRVPQNECECPERCVDVHLEKHVCVYMCVCVCDVCGPVSRNEHVCVYVPGNKWTCPKMGIYV